MGNWIVLIDADDLAEQLDVVDNHLEEMDDHVRLNVEGKYSDNNDDRDSRAWLVRFALDDYANILNNRPGGGPLEDPDLTAPPPAPKRRGTRGKVCRRSSFATVK